MKKYAMLFFVSVFMSCATLIAQDQTTSQSNNGDKKEMRQGERRHETADIRAAKMAKDLSLTDVEKINVQAHLEKQDTIFAIFRSEVSRETPILGLNSENYAIRRMPNWKQLLEKKNSNNIKLCVLRKDKKG